MANVDRDEIRGEHEMEQILERLKQEKLVDYRPIPFWSWNAELEPEELVRQIHWMQENGIGGFFMHARAGLKTGYMSEEWMQCVETCTKEAQKLGMSAWIYDENGWPSGFAGGKLLEKEEDRDQYLLAETGDFDDEATVNYRLDGEQLVRVYRKEGEGEYLNLFIHVAASTADILNPAVVDKFLSLTHEKYLDYFGERFPKEVKGFFTDEPQYQRWRTPYTKMIAQYFKEEYQEDILDSLGLLFVEKEGYRTFRYRYWKGMQTLMLQNFAGKIYGWCNDHEVRLTGHYVEENSLGWQLMCCGGVMPFYEYEHIPGVDWLGRASENELVPRQVSSVAAQLGKKQVLTESFALCGWDISPAELRRIAGFQYVNGVNLLCHHLVPYAEYGNRKHDYPAHYSVINPWVKEEFGTFNTYFTRLGYLLGEGKEQVNVAMLHPIRSGYFDYKRELEEEGFGIAALDEQLRKACRTLSGVNIAYHFLDETLLAKYGYVRDKTIGCGEVSYDYLVLPSLVTMDKSTERLLHEYVAQGGKVLLLGDAPQYLEDEAYDYPYLHSNCTLEEIQKAQPFQVTDSDTMIYATLRVLDDTPYLYAMNASDTREYSQTFRMGEGIRSFRKLDLNSLQTEQVPLTITLKPGEGVLLFPDTGEMEKQEVLMPHSFVFDHAAVSFEENYLPVDYVRYSTDGVHYSGKWPIIALFQKLLEERMEGKVYFKYEFEIREKPEVIFLRAEACNAKEIRLNGIPLTETVPCHIEKNVIAYDIAPFIKEGINEYTVQVFWHESPEVYYALFGENVTESLKNCIVYDSELEPVYVAGKFGVHPVEGYRQEEPGYVSADHFYIGRTPASVCDPVTDGLPFARGAVTMRQTVNWENRNILLKVEGSYHAADVRINDRRAGKLLFEQELDISPYAKEGENQVEIRFLIGNHNLLGPQHFNGNLAQHGVGPWNFELSGTWKDGKSPFYLDRYKLKTFYERKEGKNI